jgi:putative glutamine amidotransferase
MPARIAIPEPTSFDADYNGLCLPAYEKALRASGSTPVVVRLDESRDRVAQILSNVQGILLPGSKYDVDPQRYGEDRIPECGEADPVRASIDELLLQHAFNQKMPLLGICHGTQTLNVWRHGTLVQDLESDLRTPVNHQPGRTVAEAHGIEIAPGTRLAALSGGLEAQVNSSHHQAIRRAGDHLFVSAVSARDGVIEAVELDEPDHFVIAVQWHPERTFDQSPLSRAIFAAFVEAASRWQLRLIEAPVSEE